MKVRKPSIDFSNTPAHWAANPEFAQMWNSNSLWIPHLERLLNRVMAKAASELKGDGPETSRLRDNVRTFIRQEANHYTIHGAFNSILTREGYNVAQFERHFEKEFERLFSTKSLKFLCAYCEGFETFGPPGALTWLDKMEDKLVGARPEVVELWKWHLMEEYEHRNVCHDVYEALFGGYFMRVYGFFYQFFHLGNFAATVLRYLMARDREHMTEAELKASRKRQRAVSWWFLSNNLPAMLRALSPFYSPRNAKEPKAYRSYMAQVESKLPPKIQPNG